MNPVLGTTSVFHEIKQFTDNYIKWHDYAALNM